MKTSTKLSELRSKEDLPTNESFLSFCREVVQKQNILSNYNNLWLLFTLLLESVKTVGFLKWTTKLRVDQVVMV